MMRLRGSAALLLSLTLLTPLLFAQTPPFGTPFGLANTRYGASSGTPLLRTDGQTPFLFWSTPNAIYVTQVLRGQRHVGRPLLHGAASADFDAVWVGDHFLVAGIIRTNSTFRIVGQEVDARGRAAGEPFTIVDDAQKPRLAFNGRAILMLFTRGTGAYSIVLGRNGRPTADAEQLSSSASTPDVAASNTRFAATIQEQSNTSLVMFDENGRRISTQFLRGGGPTVIGSEGTRFLAATRSLNNELALTTLDVNGVIVRTSSIASAFSPPVEVLWGGQSWAIVVGGTTGEVIELDALAASVFARHPLNGTASAAFVNRQLTAAWSMPGGIEVFTIPTGTQEVESMAFAATRQEFLGAASSADATLVIWRETSGNSSAIYSGLRKNDGTWSELQILSSGTSALVASDGREFVMIVDGRSLYRMSSRGVALPFGSSPTPLFATAIVWDGHNYVVAGAANGSDATAFLSPAGVWSQPKPLGASGLYGPCGAIGTNGNGFLLLCGIAPQIVLGAPPGGTAAIRLDAQGNFADQLVLRRYDGFIAYGGIVWNGTRYVAAWREGATIVVAHVGPSSSADLQVLSSDALGPVSIAAGENGAWLEWSETNLHHTVAFMRDDARVTAASILPEDAIPDGVKLLRGADGSLLRVYSASSAGTPHYSQSHVIAEVAAFSLPARPGAPALTVKRESDLAILTWTAPAGRLANFRLEYAIGDGQWLEHDETLTPDRRTTTFALPYPTATYSFRIRATNEGGNGTYSFPATLGTGKRRAVR